MDRRPARLVKLAALIASGLLAGLAALPHVAAAAPGDVAGSLSYALSDARPDVPTGLTAAVTIATPAGETGPPLLSRLAFTLPDGVAFGAQARTADGDLSLCDATSFGLGGPLASGCPAASVIGRATIRSGGHDLVGPVFAAVPAGGGVLPGVFVDASVDGSGAASAMRIKLAGGMSVGGDGRLSVAFDRIPAAFSSLELSLSGGAGAPLVTPRSCGGSAGLASATSALSGASTVLSAAIGIDGDCALPGLAPRAGFGFASARSGAVSPAVASVARLDRSPRLRSVRMDGPSGALANIGSVPECGLAGDAVSACPGATRIGTLALVVGAGELPRTISGPLYLSPRSPGAVGGAQAAVAVRLGDLDLGTLAVPVRIDLRAGDAGLGYSLDVPDRFRGMDLDVRQVEVRLDAPGFATNPTSCGPLGYSATVSTDAGAASSGGEVRLAGCDALPFAPTLAAQLTGETSPGGHPNVNVALVTRAGDAALRSAAVTLPEGIVPDLANIRGACPRAQFEAVSCSATARVGTATARVAVTPEPIPGDVYLVAIPGETLPGLGLSFTGRFAQRVLGIDRIDPRTKRLVVRFDAIPDLPLSRLDLDIFGGAKGPIRIATGACPVGAVWDAAFTSHGAHASSHTIPAPCAPRAAKRSAVTLSSRYGLSWRLTDFGGRTLQSAKLTLPGGFAFDRTAARRKKNQSVRLGGATAKLAITGKSVIITAKGAATGGVALRLRGASVARSRPSATGAGGAKRVRVKVRLVFTDGNVQSQTLTVRAR